MGVGGVREMRGTGWTARMGSGLLSEGAVVIRKEKLGLLAYLVLAGIAGGTEVRNGHALDRRLRQ